MLATTTATIRQTVTFDGVPPEELFDSYLDAGRHSALVGSPVSITDRPGEAFWVFAPDAVRGRNLCVDRGGVIVQSWRATVWREEDADSVLLLTFTGHRRRGTRVQLTHAGVPVRVYDLIVEGWHDRYWRPWRTRLAHGRSDDQPASGAGAQAGPDG